MRPMVLMIGADKGGVGKTTIARTVLDYLAANGAPARAFAVYWRIIQPGSDIIRRSWLRAVKDRAERRFNAAGARSS